MNDWEMSDEQRRIFWGALGESAAAHAVVLRDVATFDDEVAAAVLTAVDAASRGDATPGQASSLAAVFDVRLEALVSPAAAGAPAVARTRAELAATALRIVQRHELLDLLAAVNALRLALLDLAAEHAFTLMPAYGEGQPLQPTSFAHWLGGIVGPLGRSAVRVRLAYAETNRSPMGAGALASTGLRIDREAVADLLGFEGPVPNTLDALAGIDHLTGALDASQAVVRPIARWLDELRVWLRTEPDALRLDDDWRADADPAVPQFRPIAGLDRLSAAATEVVGDAQTASLLLAAIPYGPAGAALDEPAARSLTVLAKTAALLRRTAALAMAILVNRAHLANRAGRDFTTASELADFIMLEEGIDPASARAIAAMSIRRATEGGMEMGGLTPQIIDGAALLVVGRELGIEIERFGGYLAPRRVLERRSATGSPNPAATRDWMELERTRTLADERWRDEASRGVAAARTRLEHEVANILAD